VLSLVDTLCPHSTNKVGFQLACETHTEHRELSNPAANDSDLVIG